MMMRKFRLKNITRVCFTGTIAMLASVYTPAQNLSTDFLQQQFDSYRQGALQEKIFLHTDKNFYLAGEICWFKIYNTDAFFNRPLSISKVAYVEVLDKNNKAVLQAKIPLKEGDGNGSLQLPVSMGSGKYRLRAYTNWMKNFSADYFFEKELTIVNSRKIYETDTLRPKDVYDIKFFPEGGNLVTGIQSKIAFRVADQNGKGVACEGVVVDDKADSIVKYTTLKFGIGSFFLTPEAGHVYKAVISLPDGKKSIAELPAAYNTGYVMHLAATGNNQLTITVRAPAANSVSSTVYLFVHTRGSVKSVLSADLHNGVAEFLVDKSKIGNGISHFTVFNGGRQPVCERLYFKYPAQRLQVGITADAQEYDIRKKINIHVSSADQDGVAVRANMSMAVYPIGSLQQIDELDINNYLWLSADLAGKIESPGYYFSNNGAGTEEAMDNLMLTHGWRRFKWEDVLQNKKPAFEFVPEYVGHIITGKIKKATTGLPAGEIKGFLSVPGTRTQFRPSISDANGQVKFDMKNFYNDGEIIVQTDSQQDSLYNVEIISPFSDKYAITPLTAFSLTQMSASALVSQHIGVQVQNTYAGDKLKQFKMPDIDTTAFYFKPDVSYLLDNYVRFTTLEEVLREYVLPVGVKRRNGRFHLPVYDELSRQFFETDPMVLLDGIPVFDLNKFMSYDPLKIKKLDVVSRMYYLGNVFFEGIANFVTYSGNLQGYELDPHATVIDYEGLQQQREFYSPVYETEQQAASRIPDFRNLLYWSPDIRTNEQGKKDISFYASDLPGKYVVMLQGLTVDGKTGSKIIQFEVKEPPRIVNK